MPILRAMTRILMTLTLIAGTAIGSAAQAQMWSPPPADPPASDDPDTPAGGGLEGLMQDLADRLAPHLEDLGQDMQGAMADLVPALRGIGAMIDDIRNYQAPERLENGDIILRRRPDAPPPPPMTLPPDTGTPDPEAPDSDSWPDGVRPDPAQPEIAL